MGNVLSDYNRSGYVPRITRKAIYSDLDFSLRRFPGGYNEGDISPLTDIDAIKNSIKNLCLTNIYERPFQPGLGSRIRFLLFENSHPLTSAAIENEIRDVITEYEPRVSDVIVTVSETQDMTAYNVSITFTVMNVIVSPFEFIINRLR